MLQFRRHVVLAVALLVVVAEALGGVPGTTHAVWQLADWELQLIMQLVTVEVCASRMFFPTEEETIRPLTATTTARSVNPRIDKSPRTA